MGTLRVYQVTDSIPARTYIGGAMTSGDQGTSWKLMRTTVADAYLVSGLILLYSVPTYDYNCGGRYCRYCFQVGLEAKIGASATSDIAIDDISVTVGSC